MGAIRIEKGFALHAHDLSLKRREKQGEGSPQKVSDWGL